MQKKWMTMMFVAFAAWFLPAFASAQTSLRDRLEDRAREVEINGRAFYRLRAEALEPYDHLLALAAPGTTPEQIDALNPHHVNYRCFRNGRGIVPPTRNGRELADGSITDVVDFATFCSGGTARRELVQGMQYLIPREIVLTPEQELGGITARITEASDADVTGVIDETDDQALAAIRRGVPPAAVADYVGAVRAGTARVTGDATVPADMTFEPHETGDVPSDAAALAAANARIVELERELAAARAASEGRWPWWATILACLIGMVLTFFLGRWSVPRTRIADEDEAPSEPTVPKRELDEARKALEAATQRAEDAEKSVETFRSWWFGIKAVYEKATGKSDPTVNDVGAFIKGAHENVVFWNGSLKGLTPQSLKEEREQARLFRMMREEWTTTPRLGLQFTVENLAMMVGTWFRFDALQKAWGGMTPAFALSGASPDGGLQAYLDDHVERQIEAVRTDEAAKRAELVAQRDDFERRLNTELSHAQDARQKAFEEINGRIGGKLDELRRVEFGIITTRGDGGKKAVDTERIKAKFGFKAKQKVTPLFVFLETVFSGLNTLREQLDEGMGRIESDDPTPEPGPLPVAPSIPPEALAFAQQGEAAPAADAPAEAGPPDAGGEFLAGFGEDRTGPATPVDPNGTRIAANPLVEAEKALAAGSGASSDLKPETTNPFAEHPDFTGTRGNGASKESRGDEPTVEVKTTNGGRERRDTQRGIGMAAAVDANVPVVEPAPEPASGGESSEDDPDEIRGDEPTQVGIRVPGFGGSE